VTTNDSTLAACSGILPLGGSTTFLINLGRAFRQRGLALPIIFLSGKNEMGGDFANAGIEVIGPMNPRFIFEDRLREAYRLIAAKRPAAVLANLGGDSFEVLRMMPKGVVRIGVIQSDDPAPYEVVREFAPWLDVVVGVSEKICQKVARDPFVTKLRIEQIPYGIEFGPARTVPPRDPAKPLRLIYIGRIIEEQKRVSRLVELAKMLTARGVKFEFTLLGSGPQMQSCRDAVSGFPNVHFLGDAPNEQIEEHLHASDIFVLLSDYEGLPLSLLEAMGEGVVPVVSDLESGMPQVVTAEMGIRVPVGDVAAAADAIVDLSRDSARLAKMANAASAFVRSEFTAAKMAKRYLELIGELAKAEVVWPQDVSVPVPLLYEKRWLLQTWSRPMRRLIKQFLLLVRLKVPMATWLHSYKGQKNAPDVTM